MANVTIPEEQIRLRSYYIWQEEGCPTGHELDHWLRAELELVWEEEIPRAVAEQVERQLAERSGGKPKRKREARK